MKIIRWAAPVLLLAATAAAIISCRPRERSKVVFIDETPRAGEQEELAFFGFKNGSLNVIAIENALHGFMNLYPEVNIAYEGIEDASYWQTLGKRASQKKMDDVIMVDHDHMMALSAENKLADLSDLPTIKNYGALAQSQFPKNGPLYFLPTCISTYGLYVNLDMLRKHGLKVPENLKEFTEVCDYFVSLNIIPIIGNNYSTLRSIMAAKGLYPVYQKENPAEEIEKFNSGELSLAQTLQPGVELAGAMLEKGWFDKKEVLSTMETWGDMEIFIHGERPFMITGGWVSPSINAANPGFKYAVYPFPILDDGSVLVQDINTCISVNADSDMLEMAKKFVEYLTQTDVIWKYCDSQSSFTPMTDDRIPADPALLPTVPYLTNGKSVVGSDYNLKLPIDSALKECGDMMLKGVNANTASERLHELLDIKK